MTEKRFTTNGYKIYDTFHDGIHWLVNQVEANEIVDIYGDICEVNSTSNDEMSIY